MKKIVFAVLLLGSTQVFAQALSGTADVCTGGSATKTTIGGTSGATVTGATFIQTGFDFNCSNNVFLSASEVSATLLAVGSASKKGNQYFGGNSNGGAISAINKCSGATCAQSDAQTGVTNSSS